MSAKEKLNLLLQRTKHTVRNFLLTKKSREFLIFLFFFLVASFFWLLQTLNETFETEVSIPVKLENVPKDVIVTMPPPESFHVVVKDRGAILVNYLWGYSFYPVTVDFNELSGADGRARLEAAKYQKTITAQMLTTSQIISVKPEIFDVMYTRGESKKIPVKAVHTVSVSKQHYVSDIKMMPDSVMVYAPKQILDTLCVAYTQPLTLADISDTVNVRQDLKPVNGVKFEPAYVDLTFCTDMYTEKKLEVPIRAVGFPPSKELKTFPSKVTVTFQVGLSRFHRITAEDFVVEVSYAELLKSETDKYKIHLKTQPEDITYVQIKPTEVDFIIEQTSPSITYD